MCCKKWQHNQYFLNQIYVAFFPRAASEFTRWEELRKIWSQRGQFSNTTSSFYRDAPYGTPLVHRGVEHMSPLGWNKFRTKMPLNVILDWFYVAAVLCPCHTLVLCLRMSYVLVIHLSRSTKMQFLMRKEVVPEHEVGICFRALLAATPSFLSFCVWESRERSEACCPAEIFERRVLCHATKLVSRSFSSEALGICSFPQWVPHGASHPFKWPAVQEFSGCASRKSVKDEIVKKVQSSWSVVTKSDPKWKIMWWKLPVIADFFGFCRPSGASLFSENFSERVELFRLHRDNSLDSPCLSRQICVASHFYGVRCPR